MSSGKLKRKMESEPEAAAIGAVIISICQTPHIVQSKYLEYVVYPDAYFHIRRVPHWLCVVHLRETEKFGVVLRIVAFAEMSVNASECEYLSEF